MKKVMDIDNFLLSESGGCVSNKSKLNSIRFWAKQSREEPLRGIERKTPWGSESQDILKLLLYNVYTMNFLFGVFTSVFPKVLQRPRKTQEFIF